MTIRWMPRALHDLESVANYLTVEAPQVESRIVWEIYEAIGSLAQMPLKGRPTNRPGVRQLLLIGIRYIITYRVVGPTVQVLRIRHTARKPLKS